MAVDDLSPPTPGRQQELPIDTGPALPVLEIIQLILARGRVTKEDIRALWGLDDAAYERLKETLADHPLIRPGARGAGGFEAQFRVKPLPPPASDTPPITFRADHERRAVERLVALLSHAELERLLGDLLYTLRHARLKISGEDRRGSKTELAVALLTRHGVDLFADPEVRRQVARSAKVKPPGRWHAGKSRAISFVRSAGFPDDYAGIPAEETPDDVEYLEGRVDLRPLQDFQREVQRKLLSVLERPGGRAIVTLPTGGGKTRVAVDTIRDWLATRAEAGANAGQTVLWLAHTEELCEQATLCFREVWQGSQNVRPLLLFRFWGPYTRNLEHHRETLLTIREHPAVLISTPQRLLNLLDGKIAGGAPVLAALRDSTGLIVIDEAHRAAAPTYRRLITSFAHTANNPAIVGLTATPFRAEYDANDPDAGTRELRELFRTIIEPKDTLGEDARLSLEERGYLARPIFDILKTSTRLTTPYGVDVDDPSEADIERIDYALKLRADKPDRRLLVLDHLRALCADPGALVLYFGPTVQDAECMAFLLRQQHIEAAFVSGDTRDVTRRKVIGDFKEGRIQVLCNCEVLTTGFDAPKVTHVVMARPTVSQVL